MKKLFTLMAMAFIIALMTTINGCKEESELQLPVITTASASEITANSAITGGTIISEGGSDVLVRGVCWSKSKHPTVTDAYTVDGNGKGIFSSNLTGLEPNTTYYVRAYAINGEGKVYGSEISFTTGSISAANIKTVAVVNITSTNATSGGEILSDGGSSILEWGLCWNTLPNPTIYSDAAEFSSTVNLNGQSTFTCLVTGLYPSTTYYIRAFIRTAAGVTYGNEISFKSGENPPNVFNPSLTYGRVTDVMGNIYKTIQIGAQTWMAENLKTTKFNDGTDIPLVTQNAVWANLLTPGYSWYNNDPVLYRENYGAIYNWYAVISNRLCPEGWHVPSESEWTTLYKYLGGPEVAGGKMKEEGTSHWSPPNLGANNSSGFTGLPGGVRRFDGLTVNMNYLASWWTTTPAHDDPGNIITAYLNTDIFDANLIDYSSVKNGSYVRCLKN